jgi:hypothetical protein
MGCLLACYVGLRIARVPVKWPTLLMGFGLTALMLWTCFTLLLHPVFNRAYIGESSAFGILSFIVSVFTVAEWPSRQWYVGMKSRIWRWLARQSRTFFLYLRDHHQFFGWLTLLAATVHTVLLFPELNRVKVVEVWTGFAALVILAALTATGEWIAWATRNKRLPKNARWWHLALTLAFILAFAAHV